jgi:hypothetical protein
MYFLSDQRRAQLICRLVNLSMPVILAQECARYQNSVVEIDRRMAFLLCGLIERFRELVAATERREEGRVRDLQAYVESDLIIFGTYQEEIRARNLPQLCFPRMERATTLARVILGETKQEFLALMGRTGWVQ